MPRREIPLARKRLYYTGMAIAAFGFLLFLSVFVSIGTRTFGSGMPFIGSFSGRGFGGMVLIIAGFGLMRLGRAGAAGSGLVLDPKRARQDLEPWARMGGGMVKDALDEAGIRIDRQHADHQQQMDGQRHTANGNGTPNAANAPLPFDEQLRRLHALHLDGIISKEEYETKKRQILENS